MMNERQVELDIADDVRAEPMASLSLETRGQRVMAAAVCGTFLGIAWVMDKMEAARSKLKSPHDVRKYR